MQRLEELEDKPFGVVDLLKEVDIRRYLPVEAHLEGKAFAAGGEFVGDVPIGDDDVFGDQPAGADPVEPRAGEIDPAHRGNGAVQQRPGLFQPLAPDLAVGFVNEDEFGDIIADRQHWALPTHDDAFQFDLLFDRFGRGRRGKRLQLGASIPRFLR